MYIKRKKKEKRIQLLGGLIGICVAVVSLFYFFHAEKAEAEKRMVEIVNYVKVDVYKRQVRTPLCSGSGRDLRRKQDSGRRKDDAGTAGVVCRSSGVCCICRTGKHEMCIRDRPCMRI